MVEAEAALTACRKEKDTEEVRLQYLSDQYQNITDWAKEFDSVNNDTKKMILARLIECIDLDRHYHLTIKFFVTMEEFEQHDLVNKDNTQITESSSNIKALAC